MAKKYAPDEAVFSFWSKVDKSGPTMLGMVTPCWVWTRATNDNGYGVAWISGRTVLAHRHTWDTAVGPIPDGLKVLHRCDNPPCVRPDHLFVGTQADNNLDADRKNRSTVRSGERNINAKLTEEIVRSSRPRWAAGESCAGLAREHGVSTQAMWFAVNGHTWRSVGT